MNNSNEERETNSNSSRETNNRDTKRGEGKGDTPPCKFNQISHFLVEFELYQFAKKSQEGLL